MTELEGTGTRTEAVPAHGGRRLEAARRYGIPKEEFLDFSASISLLGPPPAAVNAVRTAIGQIGHYPEERAAGVAQAIAATLGVAAAEVVPGNGSIEVIYWLARVLAPRRVLIVEPTFSEYRRACAGARCVNFPLLEDEGFVLDVKRIHPGGYDLVCVCNPNNPTGYLVPVDEIAWLSRRCRAAGAGLLVDEAFIDFAGGGQSILAGGLPAGLYVVRSFTKSFALSGLRLGCLVAAADFSEEVRRAMPPWNVNAFAAAAGKAALEDDGYLERVRAETRLARARLYGDLDGIPGVQPLPSEANFILCRLGGAGSGDVAGRLGRMGILVRDCRSFTGLGDRYVRVAVRSERENYQLVSALRRVMAGA